jgi:hypothetical protein
LETLLKIEFNISKDTTTFPIRGETVKLLGKMKAIDPSIQIQLVIDANKLWESAASIPADSTFGQLFKVRVESNPNGPQKLIIYFKLLSTMRFNEIKFEANMFHYLKEKRVLWIQVDRFATKKTASPGFLIEVHHKLTNLEDLHDQLNRRMHMTTPKNTKLQEEWKAANPVDTSKATNEKTKADIELYASLGTPVPEFYLQAGKRAFGGVEMYCLNVQCSEDDTPYLKSLLSSIYEKGKFDRGKFIPAGIHLIESPGALISLLRKHNQYLRETAGIPIFGATPETFDTALTTDSGDVYDLETYITSQCPPIVSIERTNKTESIGKWIFIIKKNREHAAYTFIDDILPNLFEHHVDPEDLFPDTLYPRRSPSTTVKKTVGSYASVLHAYSNPQDDGSIEEDTTFDRAPDRPKKRQAVALNFDEMDFPDLTNVNVRPPGQNSAPNPAQTAQNV